MTIKGKAIVFIIRDLVVTLKEQVQNTGEEKILITRLRIGESGDHRYDPLKIVICALGERLKRTGNHRLFRVKSMQYPLSLSEPLSGHETFYWICERTFPLFPPRLDMGGGMSEPSGSNSDSIWRPIQNPTQQKAEVKHELSSNDECKC